MPILQQQHHCYHPSERSCQSKLSLASSYPQLLAIAAMARPTAAAAGLLAFAVLLLFAGQSRAEIFNLVFPLASLFPAGYVPPIVRIYSKENRGLNMAVRDGKVAMVTATYANTYYGDKTQLWWKIPPVTTFLDGEGDKYWLVNVGMENKAMTSPTGNGQLVQLVDFNIRDGAQLWVPSTPDNYGFYQIKPYNDDTMALNGLYGGVRDGTKIGIYHSAPVTSNTLWHTTDDFPCPLH